MEKKIDCVILAYPWVPEAFLAGLRCRPSAATTISLRTIPRPPDTRSGTQDNLGLGGCSKNFYMFKITQIDTLSCSLISFYAPSSVNPKVLVMYSFHVTLSFPFMSLSLNMASTSSCTVHFCNLCRIQISSSASSTKPSLLMSMRGTNILEKLIR